MALDVRPTPIGGPGPGAAGTDGPISHDSGSADPPALAPPGRWPKPNFVTGVVGGVIGYALGHWLGNAIAGNWARVVNTTMNDTALMLGYLVGTIGFLAGLGIFNYPLAKMVGREPQLVKAEDRGLARYFRFTPDHKVVGVQYLFGMLVYFFTGGLFALAIRTELLTPSSHIFNPDTYLTIVGIHGTMMMMMMTSVIVGPFGNYFVPLMIGSKRMAFPRLEAVSFWLTPPAYVILLSSMLLGGFPTGWTGYAPLANQAVEGMDGYLMAFGLMALSMIIASINIIATVVDFRAPGMRWSRLPVFVWGVLTTSVLTALAPPVLLGGVYFMGIDRTIGTALFVQAHGGSPYLWENVFWFFGHPEVYILALPGFGLAAEMLPVFCRRRLFGYNMAAAGMIGVAFLSFFVWQHHLFMSGINADMRPMFMLTTELISIPTGFIFLVAMGTLWKAKIRMTVPMMFTLALYVNFLIGGISGVFVSDVGADVTLHGSYFVQAHFHYTIMGALIFAFFGGIYYFLPKMTGYQMNKLLGKIHFWIMFGAFQLTFVPLFIVGWLGMPRRYFEYSPKWQTLNDVASTGAYLLGVSMLVFVVNLVYSMVVVRTKSEENPWNSRGLEWQMSSPPPVENFERIPLILSHPYEYGNPDNIPVADLGGVPTPAELSVTPSAS
ncbi:MAG: cytochrome c oxidase subunit I [Acidimicrobiales bacterium]